jgi:hypothetical protein
MLETCGQRTLDTHDLGPQGTDAITTSSPWPKKPHPKVQDSSWAWVLHSPLQPCLVHGCR